MKAWRRVKELNPVVYALANGWKSRPLNFRAYRHFHFDGPAYFSVTLIQGEPSYTVGLVGSGSTLTTSYAPKAIELLREIS
jgi:hypothetical protein